MVANDRLTPDNPDSGRVAERGGARENPRRCILTGEAMPRSGLIRLAVGPDGAIAADLSGKLPGRGAWISADRALFDTVAGRGRLKGGLARALKSQAFHLPDDLAPRIAAGLSQRLLARLGLEKRAGTLLTGADRVREALLAGRVHLLLHAGDARPDGASRLDGIARAIGESLGEDIPHRHLPLGRDALSSALGKDNVVHVAVVDAGAAERLLADLDRLAGFAPQDTDSTDEHATEVAAINGEGH